MIPLRRMKMKRISWEAYCRLDVSERIPYLNKEGSESEPFHVLYAQQFNRADAGRAVRAGRPDPQGAQGPGGRARAAVAAAAQDGAQPLRAAVHAHVHVVPACGAEARDADERHPRHVHLLAGEGRDASEQHPHVQLLRGPDRHAPSRTAAPPSWPPTR